MSNTPKWTSVDRRLKENDDIVQAKALLATKKGSNEFRRMKSELRKNAEVLKHKKEQDRIIEERHKQEAAFFAAKREAIERKKREEEKKEEARRRKLRGMPFNLSVSKRALNKGPIDFNFSGSHLFDSQTVSNLAYERAFLGGN